MRRRLARQAALQVLFQIDVGQVPVNEALDWMRESVSLDPQMQTFATELVTQVVAKREEIDDLISRYSVGWEVERMAGVDRNLLRIGIYEMFYRDDIPLAVTINEMVELGKRFGDVNSSRFINGILGRIKTDIETFGSGLPDAAEGPESGTDTAVEAGAGSASGGDPGQTDTKGNKGAALSYDTPDGTGKTAEEHTSLEPSQWEE